MPTTYLRVSWGVPVVSLELDIYTSNPNADVIQLQSGVTVAVMSRGSNYIRLQVFDQGLDANFTGYFAMLPNVSGQYTTVLSATNLATEVLSVTVDYNVFADHPQGHLIYPVQLTEYVDGQACWWIRPDMVMVAGYDIYAAGNYPKEWLSGVTPPTGYESGIYAPQRFDRVKLTAEANIYDNPGGTLLGTAPVDAEGVTCNAPEWTVPNQYRQWSKVVDGILWFYVDWDNYPSGYVQYTQVVVVYPVAAVPPEEPTPPPIPPTPPTPPTEEEKTELAPVISNISVFRRNDSITIQWTTSEPAEGYVKWGPDLANSTPVSSFQTVFSVEITGLTPATTYDYQIVVSDIDLIGAVYTSTFTTEDPGYIPPTPPGERAECPPDYAFEIRGYWNQVYDTPVPQMTGTGKATGITQSGQGWSGPDEFSDLGGGIAVHLLGLSATAAVNSFPFPLDMPNTVTLYGLAAQASCLIYGYWMPFEFIGNNPTPAGVSAAVSFTRPIVAREQESITISMPSYKQANANKGTVTVVTNPVYMPNFTPTGVEAHAIRGRITQSVDGPHVTVYPVGVTASAAAAISTDLVIQQDAVVLRMDYWKYPTAYADQYRMLRVLVDAVVLIGKERTSAAGIVTATGG